MRYSLLLLVLLSLFIGCEHSYTVEIEIEELHPWEKASGRLFWYTLLYQDREGLVQTNLPIGVRKVTIPICRSQTLFCVAYPLGGGIPFGGGATFPLKGETITLSLHEGLLCEALLYGSKRWPLPIGNINYERVREKVELIDPYTLKIDWNVLVSDIIKGELDSSSFVKKGSRKVVLEDLPFGKWVCESPHIPPFTLYSGTSVELEHVPNEVVLRFINLEHSMELTLIVPIEQSESPFWHIGPLDPLLTLQEPLYHQLLNPSQPH